MIYFDQVGEQWAGWRDPRGAAAEDEDEGGGEDERRSARQGHEQMRQSANSSGGQGQGQGGEEDAGMIFCKKNGPGDATNFVPKFKVHCSKREKICQADEVTSCLLFTRPNSSFSQM
jgi:hypothetical protein